jgi:hypothetical protein
MAVERQLPLHIDDGDISGWVFVAAAFSPSTVAFVA